VPSAWARCSSGPFPPCGNSPRIWVSGNASFTALENGGGAFVIPYLIVLVLVGKPVYYLEMLLGQFSSRGSVKVYDFSPIMRGEFKKP